MIWPMAPASKRNPGVVITEPGLLRLPNNRPVPPERKLHLDTVAVSLLLACCLFWGFQQVLVKATVAEVAPVFQAALRFGAATLLLLLWCGWRRVPLWRRDGSLAPGLLVGLLFAGEFACVYIGLKFTTASRLTLFLYASPFWLALLLPRFIPGERLRGLQWVGLAAAFCGVLLALGEGDGTGPASRSQMLGDVLGLLAGLLWAATTVAIRATPAVRLSPEKLLFYQVAVAALVYPPLSLILGERWNWQLSAFAWSSIAAQAAIGAFASYLAWMWMLMRYPATRLSVFVFLTPVFALTVAALWLHEPVTWSLVAALGLVTVGIVLVNRRRAVGP
jgi:drug/metabolite transporter (DMT)-like permease